MLGFGQMSQSNSSSSQQLQQCSIFLTSYIYLVRFKMMLQMLQQAKIDKVYMTRGRICASNIVFHQRSTLSPALAVCTVNKTITQLEAGAGGRLGPHTTAVNEALQSFTVPGEGPYRQRAFILLRVPSSAFTFIKNLQKILKILEADGYDL